MPRLFEPFSLKDVTLRNRIVVSPMCQYSSENGHPTDWHFVHLGSRAVGGAGLVTVEASAVSPEGRISPWDSGIWSDDHIEPFARIARFMKEHGSVAGMQIAHAGRKASADRPWNGGAHLSNDDGGWTPIGPTGEAFGGKLDRKPQAMTTEDITRVKQDFVDAAKRTLAAGFEWLEVHFAHGYLADEFWSPLVNTRTDEYGGGFEGRARFLTETFAAVREVWPEKLPLTVRLSVTDFVDGGTTIEDSIQLVSRLKEMGLDLLDATLGMNQPDSSHMPTTPGFMIPLAGRIRRECDIPTTCSWGISGAVQAETALGNGDVDLVSLARQLLRDPYWPYHAARELNVEDPGDLLPAQYARAV